MKYGYARCSTNETKQDIDRQKRELIKLGVNEENIFWEYESGAKENRPKLKQMMLVVRQGDMIAATEVSRLTRSTKQLCEIIEFVQQKKLKLVIGSFVVDCTADSIDPMTEGMLKMWGVFAEMERKIISQRVKSGIENAKAKGRKIGRPTVEAENIPTIFMKYYPEYRDGAKNITELSKLCGMSRTTIYKYIRLLQGQK